MANRLDRSTLVRKTFHLTSPVWLVWYWVPPDSWVGVRKEGILVALLCLALLIEGARLITGRRFVGLRDDEVDRLSAYAWGSLGLALGLLFFPGEIVIVTFWGMAWIDPLCAYTRKNRGYPLIPFVAYVGLGLALSFLLVPSALYQSTPLGAMQVALVVVVGAAFALVFEKPNWKHIDDDFLMNVGPMVVLAAILAVL